MSSIRASASTIIVRKIHEVFAYLWEISTMEDWVVGASDVKLISGSGGSVGDVYEYDYTYGGRTVPMQVELTAVEPSKRIAMRALEGPFPFEGELTLSDRGDRTAVTNTIEAGSDGRFTTVVLTLFRPLMRWMMARRLRAEIVELKRVLETARDGSRQERSTEHESRTVR